ncbi:hypothetical protein DV737_g150, partial [Chaetothyriales sp. CBS 132003]
MSRGAMYAKMAGVFTICAVGAPMLMYYVVPAEGELFKQFSPELQQRNLENRERRQREYEDFLGKLKEYSRSDKPIWQAAAEAQEKARQELLAREKEGAAETERIRAEMAREMRRG